MTCETLLTVRQAQIMYLLSRGAGYKGAAFIMGISVGTVHNHIILINKILRTKSSTHAAAMIARCQMERSDSAS